MLTNDQAAATRSRFLLAGAVLTAMLAWVVFVPEPASADHGYQTYRLKNKERLKRGKPTGVVLIFDRKLSHISDVTWEPAECDISATGFAAFCEKARPLKQGDVIFMSVATPPSGPVYDEAVLESWVWTKMKNGDHHEVGNEHFGCNSKRGCKYLGVTSPGRPVIRAGNSVTDWASS